MTTSTPMRTSRRAGQYAPIPQYRWVPVAVLLGGPAVGFLIGLILWLAT